MNTYGFMKPSPPRTLAQRNESVSQRPQARPSPARTLLNVEQRSASADTTDGWQQPLLPRERHRHPSAAPDSPPKVFVVAGCKGVLVAFGRVQLPRGCSGERPHPLPRRPGRDGGEAGDQTSPPAGPAPFDVRSRRPEPCHLRQRLRGVRHKSTTSPPTVLPCSTSSAATRRGRQTITALNRRRPGPRGGGRRAPLVGGLPRPDRLVLQPAHP